MEFEITSTYYHISKLLDRYPCLTEFGFEIRQITSTRKIRILDENKKPMYQIVPTTVEHAFIKIDSLERLIKLQKAVDQELIFDSNFIEIYDGYRE